MKFMRAEVGRVEVQHTAGSALHKLAHPVLKGRSLGQNKAADPGHARD